MYKVHILKLSGRLEQFEAEIQNIIEGCLKSFESKLKNLNVDIVILDDPSSVIPEIGLGGNSPTKNIFYVYTDPGRENFSEILKKDLPSTLAHELHHCARWEAIGYGNTLLEAVISEGLADHFDIEMNNVSPPPWSTALDENQLTEVLELAQKSFNDPNYKHSDWFFGSNDQIPRWAGYSLGFYLVDKFLEKNNTKASELVGMDASKFIN